MIMIPDARFRPGDFVLLRTDPGKFVRMVCAVTIWLDGSVGYTVRMGDEQSEHAAPEMIGVTGPDAKRGETWNVEDIGDNQAVVNPGDGEEDDDE